MIIHVVSLLLGSALSLYAQVELPELDIYNYLPSQRDPFISSRALNNPAGRKSRNSRGRKHRVDAPIFGETH